MMRIERPTATVEDAQTAPDERTPTESRDRMRSRRKREVRARTVCVQRMSKRDVYVGRLLYPEDEHDDVQRPRTRADCKDAPRPCPFVSCVHHLYLDVSARTGSIKLNFPDLEPDELTESCALDVADDGGATLERVGEIMNLTRERIRQLEVRALAKCVAADEMEALRDFAPVGSATQKRRLPMLEHRQDDDAD